MSAQIIWRCRGLAIIPAIVGLIFCFMPVIEQPDWYHRFVDTRAWLGIPNFGDVVSNAGFMAIGLFGLRVAMTAPGAVASRSWITMSIGVLLVSAGSSYYHLAPANGSLVWDRLPMTIAFTAMTSAIVSEFVSPKFERFGLAALVTVGASSVLVWHLTGDLRFYFWVQVSSVFVVLYSIFVFHLDNGRRRYIVAAAAFYGLAVLSEQFDRQIFNILEGALSGHSLKHVLAAFALLMFPLRLRKSGITPRQNPPA